MSADMFDLRYANKLDNDSQTKNNHMSFDLHD